MKKLLLAIMVFARGIIASSEWDDRSYFAEGKQRLSRTEVVAKLANPRNYTETSEQATINSYFNKLYFSFVQNSDKDPDKNAKYYEGKIGVNTRETAATCIILFKMFGASTDRFRSTYSQLLSTIDRFYTKWQTFCPILALATVQTEIAKVALTLHYALDDPLKIQVEKDANKNDQIVMTSSKIAITEAVEKIAKLPIVTFTKAPSDKWLVGVLSDAKKDTTPCQLKITPDEGYEETPEFVEKNFWQELSAKDFAGVTGLTLAERFKPQVVRAYYFPQVRYRNLIFAKKDTQKKQK